MISLPIVGEPLGHCALCHRLVDHDSLRDSAAHQEWTLSGLCQCCQDPVFLVPPAGAGPGEVRPPIRFGTVVAIRYFAREPHLALIPFLFVLPTGSIAWDLRHTLWIASEGFPSPPPLDLDPIARLLPGSRIRITQVSSPSDRRLARWFSDLELLLTLGPRSVVSIVAACPALRVGFPVPLCEAVPWERIAGIPFLPLDRFVQAQALDPSRLPSSRHRRCFASARTWRPFLRRMKARAPGTCLMRSSPICSLVRHPPQEIRHDFIVFHLQAHTRACTTEPTRVECSSWSQGQWPTKGPRCTALRHGPPAGRMLLAQQQGRSDPRGVSTTRRSLGVFPALWEQTKVMLRAADGGPQGTKLSLGALLPDVFAWLGLRDHCAFVERYSISADAALERDRTRLFAAACAIDGQGKAPLPLAVTHAWSARAMRLWDGLPGTAQQVLLSFELALDGCRWEPGTIRPLFEAIAHVAEMVDDKVGFQVPGKCSSASTGSSRTTRLRTSPSACPWQWRPSF